MKTHLNGFAIKLDYYGDGRYWGYIVDEPTGHNSTFRTTDQQRAKVFNSPVDAAKELKAVRADPWLVGYPNVILTVEPVQGWKP